MKNTLSIYLLYNVHSVVSRALVQFTSGNPLTQYETVGGNKKLKCGIRLYQFLIIAYLFTLYLALGYMKYIHERKVKLFIISVSNMRFSIRLQIHSQ